MIVKDEENYLQDCLESIKNIVDQIVIVDTGSKDRTVEIAQKYGAEIYNFEWCDDFSAARNESIKYANTDWILWLDADERLIPESQKEIKKLLKKENNTVLYKIQINSAMKNSAGVRLSSAHRLFNNNHGIYFTGKIHEQISESAAKLGGEERESNLIIRHLGYDLSGEDQTKKNNRNLKLLEKMVKTDSQNGYINYTLAQQYSLNEEWHKSLKYYEKAFRLNQFDKQMRVSLLNTMSEAYLKTEKYQKIIPLCEESIELEPLQVGGYYMLYRLADVLKDEKTAVKWLELLLEKNRILSSQIKKISTDVLIDEKRIIFALAEKYKKIGNLDKAIVCFQKFQQMEPDRIEASEKLLEIYLQKGDFFKAGECLQILLNKQPANEQYIDLLGVTLIKQQKFKEAINYYEDIFQVNPRNSMALKRLVGLYGKIGEFHKANKLMEAMAQKNIS